MPATTTPALPAELTIHVHREIEIDAPIDIAFNALLDQLGPRNEGPDGTSMALKLEAWPGGRWYRDLGDNTGHLWGHVQVIKPPTLLEITGPLFMSYAVNSHVQYRLAEAGSVTRLEFTHQAFGTITAEHREGVQMGWDYMLTKIKEHAEQR